MQAYFLRKAQESERLRHRGLMLFVLIIIVSNHVRYWTILAAEPGSVGFAGHRGGLAILRVLRRQAISQTLAKLERRMLLLRTCISAANEAA